MIRNSQKKRIFNGALLSFSAGIFLTILGVAGVSHLHTRNAVGGFETQNPGAVNGADTFAPDQDLASVSSSKASSEKNLDENNMEEKLGEVEEFLPGILEDEVPALTYSTYRVKKGDMIGKIAEQFNVTQDTLISVNNIRQSRLIQVGQYLKVPSMPGILYTVRTNNETFDSIAKKYEIDAEKTASVNSMETTVSLKAGDTLFLPDAQMDWVTRQEINGDLFHRPLKSRYWMSSPYGWRSSPFTGQRSFHGGTDMATSQGTSIYAALDGRVTFTGYNETYGNYVIVTHHSGYKSLYAHMSAITCTKGQYVYTNTVIGKVGSTGKSTGPHLHFAVYKNGKSLNPMSLVN